MASNAQQMAAGPRGGGNKGSSKFFATLQLLFGAVLFAAWVMASLLQIQTTEAWISGGSAVVGFHPDWAILAQPYHLVTGDIPAREAQADFEAWIIELFSLVFTFGMDLALLGLFKANKKLAEIAGTCTLIIIGLNGFADFQFGSFFSNLFSSAFWGHLLFSALVGVAVMYLGVIGVAFMEHAIVNGYRA